MPTINRQTSTNGPAPKPVAPTGRPARPTGSVLSEVVPVSALPTTSIKMVVYGENRVGKTTLACKFPKPLLLISMEPNKTGGAQSVKKMPGVEYLKINESAKAVKLAKELRGDKYFKTVVVDSATSYQDIILREILNLPNLPEMLSWGTVTIDQYRERSEKTRECLRPFIDLECNTIITAKQRDHNKQEGYKRNLRGSLHLEAFFAADLGGATTGWLHDCCDYICHLSIQKEIITRELDINGEKVLQDEETGKLIRRLRTMYHPNFAAGFRSCDPDLVPEFIDEPDYQKIAAVIEGQRPVVKK